MLKEPSAWYGWPRATEQLQFTYYFWMSSAERLQFVLRSGYGEQTTNNEELKRIEEEMDAHR